MASSMSPAALELHCLLEENSEACRQIKDRVDRMQLWRYRTGKGYPSVKTAALLETLSGGRIKANGWVTEGAEEPAA
jgi:hypothetical protein